MRLAEIYITLGIVTFLFRVVDESLMEERTFPRSVELIIETRERTRGQRH